MPTVFSDYSDVASATTEDYTLVSRTMPGIMRLFMLSPTVVFAARINMPTAGYPLESITFDGVTTGAFGDIKPGMTILLGSAAGLGDYGRQRVRKVATSTAIPVGISSQGIHDGELDIHDNAYVTVWNDYRVWAKIFKITTSGATSTTYKDADIAYTNQNTESPPVANTGPGFAGTINVVDGLITVEFDGTGSFATTTGGSITDYLWDVDDGTITVGADDDDTITATFEAGFRYVSLTVTDDNGKEHTARCPVYARDPAADTTIQNWQIENHRISQQGQQIGLRVFDDLPGTTYPDGTLVMIWEGESSAADDRSTQIFHGWHHTDPASISAERNGIQRNTTLNCLDVAGKLAILPSFPQTLSREVIDAPLPPWSLVDDLNIDRMMWYMWYWHSTALEVTDWTWTSLGSSYNMFYKTTDAGNLWEQISKLSAWIVPNHVMTCNTLGQIRTLPDPMLLNTGSRTATVQVALDEDDWSDIRWTHQRPATQHWLRGSAVLVSTDPPPLIGGTAFCVAPGVAPGQGEQAGNFDFQLTQSQSDLNNQEGHRYARINNRDSHYNITLTANSDLGIEPADMTWVSMDMDDAGVVGQRGNILNEARGLVHNISIRYDYQKGGWVRTVELEWERETSSTSAAVTDPHPVNTAVTPEFELPADFYTPPPGTILPGTLPTGQGTVYAMSGKQLIRTLDFSAASPVWVDIGPAQVTVGKTFRDFILDPWRPHTDGYLSTFDGLYKSTDLDATTPTWDIVLSPADILAATGDEMTQLYWSKVMGSPNADGYVILIYETEGSARLWCAVSFDGGATWEHVEIPDGGGITGSAASTAAASDIVPHTIDGNLVIYIAHNPDAGGDGTPVLYKSADAGLTWAVDATFPEDTGRPHTLHCPYDGNEDGNLLYVGTVVSGDAAQPGRLYKVESGVFTDVSPITDHGVGVARTGVETYTQDNQIVYAWAEKLTGDPGHTFWSSDDGGATWTAAATSGWTSTQTPAATSGFPYNGGQVYLQTRQSIYLSLDNGATFVDKTGDSPIAFNDYNTVDGFGGGVILPDWTI